MVCLLSFSAINVLQLILSCFSALLGLYVFSLRRPIPLAAFLLAMCLHSGIRAFRESLSYEVVAYSFSLGFLYGPLIYLTLRDILNKQRFSFYTVIHFLPFVLALISRMNGWGSLTDFGTALCLYSFLYVYMTYRTLYIFARALEHTRASQPPPEYFWLQRIIWIFSIMVIYQSSRFILGLVFSNTVNDVFELGFFLGSITLFSLLIYRGMQGPSIVPDFDEEDIALSKEMSDKSRRNISNKQRELVQQLELIMRSNKPFLDPNISVKLLATEMDISGRQVSELINDYYGYSFSELINRARINEATRLIENDPDCPFLDIAMSSGFSSKSSFNLMFKRYLQQTPTQFRTNLAVKRLG